MKFLSTLLWSGNDPMRAREVAKAFAEIGVETDITPGVDTLYRVWRAVPAEKSFLKLRASIAAFEARLARGEQS